ncbi:MAG: hypothetical protein ACI9EW_003528 [Cellvibrionaceae bacterium]|jgi:hypothetical protein
MDINGQCRTENGQLSIINDFVIATPLKAQRAALLTSYLYDFYRNTSGSIR